MVSNILLSLKSVKTSVPSDSTSVEIQTTDHFPTKDQESTVEEDTEVYHLLYSAESSRRKYSCDSGKYSRDGDTGLVECFRGGGLW